MKNAMIEPELWKQRSIKTCGGIIQYPAYIPVTTFGDTYPLDSLIQPYLPRLAPAVMVSFFYAQAMGKRPRLPLLIDSGGFAALFEGAVIEEEQGLGILRYTKDEKTEVLSPGKVLDFQERNADLAFTLDFPIPPRMDREEAQRRVRLTIANAVWALENRRRRDMPLFACLQGLEMEDYLFCAKKLSGLPFDGFAIGGIVPRARDWPLVKGIVEGVRRCIGDRPLHVFGMGKPETTQKLFSLGVDSVDSSSYVKLAADGKSWSPRKEEIEDPATTDRLMLALGNLAMATSMTPRANRMITFSAWGMQVGSSVSL